MKAECLAGSAALLALLLLIPFSASAGPFDGGRLSFDYFQFPFGSYGGSFHAEGSVLDPDFFPPVPPGAVVGIRVFHENLHLLLVVGGFLNPDASGDIAFLLMQSPDPFAPGVYPVDPLGYSVMLGFLDDASGLRIPEEPWTVDWGLFYDAIVAGHKFAAFSGAVVLTKVEPNVIEGTFACFMTESDGPLNIGIANGSVSAGVVPLPVAPNTWGQLKSKYRD